jgi:hypothetical protein
VHYPYFSFPNGQKKSSPRKAYRVDTIIEASRETLSCQQVAKPGKNLQIQQLNIGALIRLHIQFLPCTLLPLLFAIEALFKYFCAP